jgi:chorismate synthase
MMIINENTRSGDYDNLVRKPRPGHADYTGFVRYNGFNDVRGGGHFSGRLTAPLVFAGAICRQILRRRGITVGGHILEIGGVCDEPLDAVKTDASLLDSLSSHPFSLLNQGKEQAMRDIVESARLDGDSVGGIVEIAAVGLPAGLGSPMFDGIENRLAPLLFGVPAVKGVEFGDGFGLAAMRGSQANDPFCYTEKGSIGTTSNHNGGILGGITNGMPLILRTVLKPTPSISKTQQTVDLQAHCHTDLSIQGRHDPCIVPRALPVIESVTALGLLDIMESQRKNK